MQPVDPDPRSSPPRRRARRVVEHIAKISAAIIDAVPTDIARREAAVDVALEQSFPASDPPAWTSGIS